MDSGAAETNSLGAPSDRSWPKGTEITGRKLSKRAGCGLLLRDPGLGGLHAFHPRVPETVCAVEVVLWPGSFSPSPEPALLLPSRSAPPAAFLSLRWMHGAAGGGRGGDLGPEGERQRGGRQEPLHEATERKGPSKSVEPVLKKNKIHSVYSAGF